MLGLPSGSSGSCYRLLPSCALRDRRSCLFTVLHFGKVASGSGSLVSRVPRTRLSSLGETVIMVQRPHLNLLNSSLTCAIAFGANLWLIPRFGVTGAAFGILLPYVVQGILRYGILRLVLGWRNSWNNIRRPIAAAMIAFVPALGCRLLVEGIPGQVIGALLFIAIFGAGWLLRRRSANPAS